MDLHWYIKLANMILVVDLGIITLWLLAGSLTFDKVRRSSPFKRAELLIKVFREGSLFLKFQPKKSHYLIGRGPESDIQINGPSIPLKIGELRFKREGNFFKKFPQNLVYVNRIPVSDDEVCLTSGDEIACYGYLIKLTGNSG
jgi:hypothetical protein